MDIRKKLTRLVNAYNKLKVTKVSWEDIRVGEYYRIVKASERMRKYYFLYDGSGVQVIKKGKRDMEMMKVYFTPGDPIPVPEERLIVQSFCVDSNECSFIHVPLKKW